MRVIATNKNPWTQTDTELLIEIVESVMIEYGVIDPIKLGDYFDRTASSIKWKLDTLRIPYKTKVGVPQPVFETPRRRNMREMPLHSGGELIGKPVHYSRYYNNAPTGGNVYEAFRNPSRTNPNCHGEMAF